ncbi:MAG: hypothetical protein ACTSRA_11865 [Promethearchaeota archaeon]
MDIPQPYPSFNKSKTVYWFNDDTYHHPVNPDPVGPVLAFRRANETKS